MPIGIPKALKAEHAELHEELVTLTRAPGPVGAAARRVATLLHPHFVREEQYALPPLGLLVALSRGRVPPGARGVLRLTDRLEADLGRMLREHRQVARALRGLAAAARRARRPEAARFADKLRRHAESEEQVLYPAALLVGRWVRERAGR